ncbi:hypothetical protein J2R99_000964 [Rhodopseudomonas julia]|uniref:Uncharacterized protein n=1 Tax=Rhodopseudomonas julia TaxID=200617 RepID=A0ABU0C658_9BRAD|nr:hypothetical protein [Rhodopseudomonas julia]MDQ0325115.1 hypothetical protein [Rhodopseudomonas julia]
MTRLAVAGATAAFTALAFAEPAAAQERFPACQSQQSLQQIIGSNGELMPSDCRNLTITRLKSDSGSLCLIDFSNAGGGVVQALRDAAMPEKWWVRCDQLSETGG